MRRRRRRRGELFKCQFAPGEEDSPSFREQRRREKSKSRKNAISVRDKYSIFLKKVIRLFLYENLKGCLVFRVSLCP